MPSNIQKRSVGFLTGLAILMLAVTARAAEMVYVPMGSDDKIVIIDPLLDRVVGEINGIPAVHGLAGTPDGRHLIAGSLQERDPDGGLLEIPDGMSEADHASHHQSPAASANTAGPTASIISIINTTDRSIVRRVVVSGPVHHVAVSPDGKFAVVTHPDQGMISVIRLSTYTQVAAIKTGPLPNYAAFNQDGTKAYVSNAGNNTVSEIDTKSWSVRRNIPTGASPEHVVISHDGSKLYVNNVDDGMVSAINLERGTIDATYAVGPNLHGIDIADDGSTLFVASRGDEKLVAIDVDDGSMRYIDLAPEPYHLATIHGTGKLYVSSAEAPIIWVIDQATLAILAEVQIGGKGHQIVQSVGG